MDIKAKKENKKLRILNTVLIKYFRLIMFFIVVLILIFGFFKLIKPKYDKVSQEMQSTIELKKEEQSGLNNLLTKMDNYWKAYNSISEEDKDKINIILPDDIGDVELLLLIEKIIKDQDLLLTNISISSSDDKKDTERRSKSLNKVENNQLTIGVIDIAIDVMGVDYKKLKKLLESFENNLRIFDIKSLSFSPDGLSASLMISTYYLK